MRGRSIARALGREETSSGAWGSRPVARAWGARLATLGARDAWDAPGRSTLWPRRLSPGVRALASEVDAGLWPADDAFVALLEVYDLQSRLTARAPTEETIGDVFRYYPALEVARRIAAERPALAPACRREAGRLPVPEPARTQLLDRLSGGEDPSRDLASRAARIRAPFPAQEPASEPLGSKVLDTVEAFDAAIARRDEDVIGHLDDATLRRFAGRLEPAAMLAYAASPRPRVEVPYVHSGHRGAPPPPPPEEPSAKWCDAIFRLWDRGLALGLPGFGDVRGVFESSALMRTIPFERLGSEGQRALARLFRRAEVRATKDASARSMDPIEVRDSDGAPRLFRLYDFAATLGLIEGAATAPVNEVRHLGFGDQSFDVDRAVAIARSQSKALFQMDHGTLAKVAHRPEVLDLPGLLARHPAEQVFRLVARLFSSHRQALDTGGVANVYAFLNAPIPERFVNQESLTTLHQLASEARYPVQRLRIETSEGIVPCSVHPFAVPPFDAAKLFEGEKAYHAEDDLVRARGALELVTSLRSWNDHAYAHVLSLGVAARLGPLGAASASAYRARWGEVHGREGLAKEVISSGPRHPAALAVALGTLFRDPTDVVRSCLESFDLSSEARARWVSIAEELSRLGGDRLGFVIQELDRYPDFESVPVRLDLLRALGAPERRAALRAILDRASDDPARASAIQRALWGYVDRANPTAAELEAIRSVTGASNAAPRALSAASEEIARAIRSEAPVDPALERFLTAVDDLGPSAVAHVADALREWIELDKAWKIPLDDFERVHRELEGFVRTGVEPAFQRGQGEVIVAGVRLQIDTREKEDGRVPALVEPTWTPSTLRLYHQAADALAAGQGRRIEGPPGEGKSSVVQFLAAATNRGLRRVNLRPTMEQSDLIGFYGEGEVKHGAAELASMGDAGRRRLCREYGIEAPEDADKQIAALMVAQRRVEWIRGVVVEAMVDGDILLLEEYDLASPAVLEGALNSVLDKRRSAGRGGERIDAHPDFVLFATGNSVAELGRREPSAAFRSRLSPITVHPSTREDFEIYVSERLGAGTAGGSVDRALVRGLADLQHGLRALAEKGDLGWGSEVVFTYRDLKKVTDRFNALRGDPRHGLSDADLLRREANEIYRMRFASPAATRAVGALLDRCLPVSSPAVELYGSLVVEETETEVRVHDITLPKVNADPSLIPPRDVRLFDTERIQMARYLMMKALAMKENVLLVGDPGCGKTALAEEVAHFAAQPFHRVVLHESSDHYDLIGARSDRGFEPKPVVEAAPFSKENPPGLVLIDEANLAREGVLDELNRLFDARELELPTQKAPLVFDDQFKMVLAMNDESLAGRKSLSRPVSNRMTILFVPPSTDAELRAIVRGKFAGAGVRPEILDAFAEIHKRINEAYASGTLGRACPSAVLDVANPRTLFRAVEMFARVDTSAERVGARLVEVAENVYAQSADPSDNEQIRRMILAWLSSAVKRGRA